ERDSLLDERIPDRMLELHLCTILIGLLKNGQKLVVEIRTNGKLCKLEPSRVLLHSSLDTAIMMCRAVLHFLGIRDDINILKSQARDEDTDISIEHFGRPLMTVAQATGGSAATGKALLLVLKAANKGVGHLTIEPARFLARDLEQVRIACNRITELINEYLY